MPSFWAGGFAPYAVGFDLFVGAKEHTKKFDWEITLVVRTDNSCWGEINVFVFDNCLS